LTVTRSNAPISKEEQMNTSTKTRLSAAALVAVVIAAAGPTAAGAYTTTGDGGETAAPADPPESAFIPRLPRSPSEATPFVAEVGTEALRRDPGQATQFVAEQAPEAAPRGDGFDWGDAAIGAGAGLLAAALVAAGSGAVRRDRPRSAGQVPATSQGV
jgi:hypothetical protein